MQSDSTLHIKCLIENHPAIIRHTDFHFLVKKHQATEYRFFLIVAIAQLQSTDDIQSILSAQKQFPTTGTEDGTLVEWSRLKSVSIIEIADGKRPNTVILLLRGDIRETMIGGHPHRMTGILRDRDGIGTIKPRLHIKQCLLPSLAIIDDHA